MKYWWIGLILILIIVACVIYIYRSKYKAKKPLNDLISKLDKYDNKDANLIKKQLKELNKNINFKGTSAREYVSVVQRADAYLESASKKIAFDKK